MLAVAEGVAPGGWWEDLPPLTLLGLAGFIDPVRPDAADAVAECQAAGIRVVMVTGDHPVTALAIARTLGIATRDEDVATGEDLDELGSIEVPAYLDRVGSATVFARVAPLQKLSIVEALLRLGHFVAVTGDGANDAPALQRANIGVAITDCIFRSRVQIDIHASARARVVNRIVARSTVDRVGTRAADDDVVIGIARQAVCQRRTLDVLKARQHITFGIAAGGGRSGDLQATDDAEVDVHAEGRGAVIHPVRNPRATVKRVGTHTTIDGIVVGTTEDRVVARKAAQDVIAAVSIDDISRRCAGLGIIRIEGVVMGCHRDAPLQIACSLAKGVNRSLPAEIGPSSVQNWTERRAFRLQMQQKSGHFVAAIAPICRGEPL